ncbi:MAG TPA: polyprenyl synthetase family protein [Gemmatimonadaceae bacterium]|nr:polyprenyl synthetase family protein [Gemmatimonadaceae bacterium]
MKAILHARTPSTPTLRDIQAPIRDRLVEAAEELKRIVTSDLPLIDEVNAHLLLMKGKMFRPTLVLLASEVAGRSERRASTLAATVELVHLATLVHDDSVDHSTLRRGMPTVNSLFTHQVSVIMGDFLYSRAMVELVRTRDIDILGVLADATNEMTIGEMRQLTALDALAFTEDDYEALIRAKTASLLSAACEIGALVGGSEYREQLARYGLWLGMAFQVADDLLDYTADAEMIGKPSGLDLREHKVTLPLIAALRNMTPSARREVDELFANPEPTDEQIERVVAVVEEGGGLDYAARRADEYAAAAEAALDGLPDSPILRSLRDAIAYAVKRSR